MHGATSWGNVGRNNVHPAVPSLFYRGVSRAQTEAKRLHKGPPTTAQKPFRNSIVFDVESYCSSENGIGNEPELIKKDYT